MTLFKSGKMFRRSIIAALSAAVIGLAFVSTAASARPGGGFRGGGFHGFHGGFRGGFHGGFRRFGPGIGLGIGTDSQGMNFLFRDYTNEAPVRHFQFRDDGRAWGPTSLTSAWTNNTWYWLRLRQDPRMDGSNTVFGKAWPADWVTPEPAGWQLTWADSALPTPHRTGYAGLTASSNDGLAQYEVSYFLLKAAGLPSIQVSAAASPPGALSMSR